MSPRRAARAPRADGPGTVVTRGRTAAPGARPVGAQGRRPVVLGHRPPRARAGDRGDRHRRRRPTFGGTLVGQAASRPPSGRSQLRGPLRPGRRRHRGLRQRVLRPRHLRRRRHARPGGRPAVRRARRHRSTAPTAPRSRRWPPATSPPPAWPPTRACTRSRCSTPPAATPTSSTSCSPSTTSPTWPTAAWTSRPPTSRCPAAPPSRRTATSGPDADSDAVAFRAAIQQLAARGIATTVATGNDGQTGQHRPAGVRVQRHRRGRVRPRRPDRRLRQPRAHDGARRARAPTRATAWSTRWTSPGARSASGPAPPSPRRTWPAPSRCCRPSTRRHRCTSSWPTSGPPARSPPTPPPAPTYRRLRLRPPSQSLPAGVLFPASAAVAGTTWGVVGDFDGDGFERRARLHAGRRRRPDLLRRASWTPRPAQLRGGRLVLPVVGNFRGSNADDILWYAPGPGGRLGCGSGAASRTFAPPPLTDRRHLLPARRRLRRRRLRRHRAGTRPARRRDTLWFGGPPGSRRGPCRSAALPGGRRRHERRRPRRPRVPRARRRGRLALARHRHPRHLGASPPSSIGGTNVLRAGRRRRRPRRRPAALPGRPGADSIWRGGPAVGGGGPTGGFSPLPVSVNGSYVPSVGDIDGDGRDDILWYAAGRARRLPLVRPAAGAPVEPQPLGVGHLHPAPRRPRRRRRRRHRLVPDRHRHHPRVVEPHRLACGARAAVGLRPAHRSVREPALR